MPERKTKLLLVIAHLVQSGSERFTYEICKTIDRTRFDVEVLTKRRVKKSDYYYEKIRALGIPIHRRLPIFLNRVQRHARPFYLAFRPLLETLHRWCARAMMGDLLSRFDVINAVQIENYYLLQPLLKNNDRVVISLMSNAFQYGFDPYADCKAGREYRFIVTDPSQLADYEHSHCAGAATHLIPLPLDLSNSRDLSEHAKSGAPYDIGVFMRLSPERPIAGLFRALQHLLKEKKARLRVYGRGDPTYFDRELGELGIRDSVLFEGHAESIEETLRSGDLSMVWMTCVGATLGYASIEIASFAFPMLFWNLSAVPDETVSEETSGALTTFRNPEELALASARLLDDRGMQIANGRRLRDYMLRRYDIASHIRDLEHFFQGVARVASAR